MKILKLKLFYLLSIILFSNFNTHSSITKYLDIQKFTETITNNLLNKMVIKVDENKIALLAKIIEHGWRNPATLRFRDQFKTLNTSLLSFVIGLISTKSIDYLLSNNDFYNSLKDFISEKNIDDYCIPILILTTLYSSYNIYKINKNNNNKLLNLINNIFDKFICDKINSNIDKSDIDKIINDFIKNKLCLGQIKEINNLDQFKKDLKSYLSKPNNNFSDICNNILLPNQKSDLISIKSKLHQSKNNIDNALKKLINDFTIDNLEKYHNSKINIENLEDYQDKIINDFKQNKDNALNKLKKILDANKFIELENYLKAN